MTVATDHGEVRIQSEPDIAVARRVVRDVASAVGFGITEVARIVTAASELGRNVHKYAASGVMSWRIVHNGSTGGIELRFEDHGPGIPDIDSALQEGYSTGGGLGMGLPGTRRLMDEMEVQSAPGQGTNIVVRKWRRQ
jgi:serine/threonine-protein kinase RsbT